MAGAENLVPVRHLLVRLSSPQYGLLFALLLDEVLKLCGMGLKSRPKSVTNILVLSHENLLFVFNLLNILFDFKSFLFG